MTNEYSRVLNMKPEPVVPGVEPMYLPGDKPITRIPLTREQKWDLFPKIVFLGMVLGTGVYMVIYTFVSLLKFLL